MINDAEKALGYTFKDKSLLTRALTLASASDDNNQLLEFFGDAIIEFIVSEKIFPGGKSEKDLTDRRKALVSDEALEPVSRKLGLDKLLICGKNDNNNKKAVPSAYEAVVAAIYLDGGMEEAKKFVLNTMDFDNPVKITNYKGDLQELLQGMGKQPPEYVCVDVGNAKHHIFNVTVNVFGQTFTGEAESIKTAEQLAAKAALGYYKQNQ